MTVHHVATTGSDTADGSATSPLRTINRAAALAMPGDTVRVHAGEYREWVRPARGGLSDRRRITYEAAPGERVVLKGSERVTDWVHHEGTVWRAEVPNALFGEVNPFAVEVDGDWLLHPPSGERKHLGDVYLDGRSLYEVADVAAVVDPRVPVETVDGWTGLAGARRDADATRYVWHAEVGAGVDDDLGQLPGRRPDRRTGRDQRAPLGLLPHRAPPRPHHRARLRDGARRHAVGAADRRPARPDRAQLGQGLDHRGQRHPRRQVRGDLARQGGVHRAQPLQVPRRQARLPVPARGRLRGPPDRVGPPSTSARTSCVATRSTTAARTASSGTSGRCSPPSRTTTSTTSGPSASSTATRSAASSCTPRSTCRSGTTASTTARSASGSTGRPRARASRATSSTPTPATCSSRSATARTSSTTTSSPPRSRWRTSARAARSSTISSAGRCGSSPSSTGRPRTTARTAPRSWGTRSSTGATTAGSATSSSAGTSTPRTVPAAPGTVRPPSAPRATTGSPRRSPTTWTPWARATTCGSTATGSRPTSTTTRTRTVRRPYDREQDAAVLGGAGVVLRRRRRRRRSSSRPTCRAPSPLPCVRPVTSDDLPPVRFVGADFEDPDGVPGPARHRPRRHPQGARHGVPARAAGRAVRRHGPGPRLVSRSLRTARPSRQHPHRPLETRMSTSEPPFTSASWPIAAAMLPFPPVAGRLGRHLARPARRGRVRGLHRGRPHRRVAAGRRPRGVAPGRAGRRPAQHGAAPRGGLRDPPQRDRPGDRRRQPRLLPPDHRRGGAAGLLGRQRRPAPSR